MKLPLVFISLLILMSACRDAQPVRTVSSSATAPADSLRNRLADYLRTKQATIGVAIMGMDDADTISVNGHAYYPLMSVAKFPQALLLLHLVDSGTISMDAPLHFDATDLKQRTASTLRKDHPQAGFELSIPEALRYSIGQSDNITSNKIFQVEGGPEAVSRYVHNAGIKDIRILTDYAHMGDDSLHQNSGTPMAMVRLLKAFHRGDLLSDSSSKLLWKLMVESVSGPDRLKGQLPPGTIVAHKTGTGPSDSRTGITAAFNDVGIVMLPDGRHFAIAVFVADSREPQAMNAEIIAHICKEAWDYFMLKGTK